MHRTECHVSDYQMQQSKAGRSRKGRRGIELNGVDYQWQWSDNEGFRDYGDHANRQIEAAYRNGRRFFAIRPDESYLRQIEIVFADMIHIDLSTGTKSRIRRQALLPDSRVAKALRKVKEFAHLNERSEASRRQLGDIATDQRQELLDNIDKPIVKFRDLYHDRGLFACIVRSRIFVAVSMTMVLLNAGWLGYEAEKNDAEMLYSSDIFFIIVENVFCGYFLLEVLIRFAAFKRKCHALQDAWMIFDTILVVLMIVEVWLWPLLEHFTQDDALSKNKVRSWAVLRVARILKIVRLGRLARIIRQFPELVAMCKAIFVAVRSVFFTFLLLTMLLYAFAIIFVSQIRSNDAIANQIKDFKTISASMWLLSIEGVMLDGPKDTLNILVQHDYFLTGVFLLFIILSAFTIVNMLIGIICNVVQNVSELEQDKANAVFLQDTLLEHLRDHDRNCDHYIRKDEFEELMRHPETHAILDQFGVDARDLLSMKENLFDHEDTYVSTPFVIPGDSFQQIPAQTCLSHGAFLQVVFRLRKANSVKVTDMVDLRQFIKQRLDTHREYVSQRFQLLERQLLGAPVAPQSIVAHGLGLRDAASPESFGSSGCLQVHIDEHPDSSQLAQEQQSFAPQTGEPSIGVCEAASSDVQLSELLVAQQHLANRQSDVEKVQAVYKGNMWAFHEQTVEKLNQVQKQLAQLHQIIGHTGKLEPPGGQHAATPQDRLGSAPNLGPSAKSMNNSFRRTLRNRSANRSAFANTWGSQRFMGAPLETIIDSPDAHQKGKIDLNEKPPEQSQGSLEEPISFQLTGQSQSAADQALENPDVDLTKSAESSSLEVSASPSSFSDVPKKQQQQLSSEELSDARQKQQDLADRQAELEQKQLFLWLNDIPFAQELISTQLDLVHKQLGQLRRLLDHGHQPGPEDPASGKSHGWVAAGARSLSLTLTNRSSRRSVASSAGMPNAGQTWTNEMESTWFSGDT